MSDKAAGFLDDIIAHPDDNTPRLIFADYLDDHGDGARAEFIRAQVERASLPDWDARAVRLLLREHVLLTQHGERWKAQLPTIKGVTWGEFRRGFVATVQFATFATFEKKAAACWEAAPLEAAEVRWPRDGDASETFAPIPSLRELSVTGTVVDPRDVRRLANSPVLSTLRALNARGCSMGAEAFARLVDSVYLGNLQALRVPFNSLGNGAIDSLVGGVRLPALTELDLSELGSYGRYSEDPTINWNGMRTLAAWPGLARIRSLTLSGNDIGRAGLWSLLHTSHCTSLKQLTLRSNGITAHRLREFAAAPAGLQLDVLDLGENMLFDRGVETLGTAACLRELKVLELDRCEMPAFSAIELAEAPFLATLRRLNLNSNSFGAEGLATLLAAKPPELHTLGMIDNDLGDEGVKLLADTPASDTLLDINLAQNNLTEAALKALGKSKHLKNLLALRLQANGIDTPAAAALAKSKLGKRLAVLELSE
jgi:uncharacterized protein (TIGR02996 family)